MHAFLRWIRLILCWIQSGNEELCVNPKQQQIHVNTHTHTRTYCDVYTQMEVWTKYKLKKEKSSEWVSEPKKNIIRRRKKKHNCTSMTLMDLKWRKKNSRVSEANKKEKKMGKRVKSAMAAVLLLLLLFWWCCFLPKHLYTWTVNGRGKTKKKCHLGVLFSIHTSIRI